MKNVYDENICRLFRSAEEERQRLESEYVSTEHLLLAILKYDNKVSKYLKSLNVTYDTFSDTLNKYIPSEKNESNVNIYTPLLKKIISQTENPSEGSLFFNILNEGEGVAIRILMNMDVDVDNLYNYFKNDNSISNLKCLKYGEILNETAAFNEKVVGREKEIDLILETLLRKKKCNPLLIGDAGVGKSAIVEEIARRIKLNKVPFKFKDFIIVSLSMSSLIAGTKYRGEFEERLNNILDQIKDNDNVILFIDEMHTMVNAGAAEGAISAGDILKPTLARGNIKCIGATTKEEYEKYFIKDKALARRFETIFIKEPTENETIDILKSIKEEYTTFHKVNISDENIELLVHLANVYFPNKKNPDKAIELLDSTLSYVKYNYSNGIIKEKELKLKGLQTKKIYNIELGNFKEALIKSKEEKNLLKDLTLLKSGKNVVATKEDILNVLELKNNIIDNSKKVKRINNLKKDYHKNIINKITSKLENNRVSVLTFVGDYKNLINDLASSINYDILKVNANMEKIFDKLKYNPSTIFVVNSLDNYNFNNIVKKAKENNLVEYNNEYVSFNSAIVIYTLKENNIGFINSNSDDVIYFDTATLR